MSAKAEPIPDDIAKLSFEEAMAALEDIVGKLESGDVSLEDSIEIYTRGTMLRRHCQEKLGAAQARIEKITLSEVGAPEGTEPFDAD